MNSAEIGTTLRAQAIDASRQLQNPNFGLSAGIPWFNGLFGRDILVFTKLVLSKTANLRIPGLLDSIIFSLDMLERWQSYDFVPVTEAEPGKIPHQWMNGFTPPGVLDGLEKGGWPVFTKSTGERELVYYGSGDSTSRYISGVADVGRALEQLTDSSRERDLYLARKFPSVKLAYHHQMTSADIDGDGLIETVPHNHNALLHHTERDNNDAYTLEHGTTPNPPYKYLSNNCHRSEGFENVSWMATLAGEVNLAKEAKEMHLASKALIREKFWVKEWGYPTSLVFADGRKADFISDEALDGMWCGIWDEDQARQIVDRIFQPDMMTPYGQRGRSAFSRQFHINGPKAYWDGVWGHRVAIAAEAFERYGFYNEAIDIDRRLENLVTRKGFVELVSVDRKGHLFDYTEHGIPKACNPQLWTVGGILARTAS